MLNGSMRSLKGKTLCSSINIQSANVKLHCFHGNPLCDFKILGVYLKQYSYLNNNTSLNSKSGIKLICRYSTFIWWLDMQVIYFVFSWMFMKKIEMNKKSAEKSRGNANKITSISFDNCPRNENIRKEWKIVEKLRLAYLQFCSYLT